MKKRLIGLFVLLCIILPPAASVSAEDVPVYFGGPKTFVLTEKYCTQKTNAAVADMNIEFNGTGTITFGFYLEFDCESVAITFNGTAKAIAVTGGNETFIIDGENNTHVFENVLRKGEYEFDFSSGETCKIDNITFHKKPLILSGFSAQQEFELPDYTKEEWGISSAIIIHTEASAIIVSGSRRYINNDDPDERAWVYNDTAYLPIHTLARAFNCYYEDLQDKSYALLRKDDVEFLFAPDICYRMKVGGNKESVDNVIRYQDGITYAPVRYFAEAFGYSVGYKNNLIAIDSNQYTVRDILNDSSLNAYVLDMFTDFIERTQPGRTYFVSQTAKASDSNRGSECAPFRTISRAGEVAQAGDTVIVKAGTYRETVTVKNNGTAASPIVFKAAEGEKVVISANEEITNFASYQDNILIATVPFTLGEGRNQVFYHDKSIMEARYPNGPRLDIGGPLSAPLSDNWPIKGEFRSSKTNNNTILSDTLLNQEEQDYWKGAYIALMRGMCYAMTSAKIEGSSEGEVRVIDTPKYWWDMQTTNEDAFSGSSYGYIFGSLKCMDLPGEWVMQNNILFIIPPESESSATLKLDVKKRQLVADLADNKYVQLRGFETIGGSIRLNNSEMCIIDSCNIYYNNHYLHGKDQHSGFIDDGNVYDKNGAPSRGEVGLYVGGQDNVFTNNVIKEAAGAGLYITGLYAYIENNIISDTSYQGSNLSSIYMNGEAWESKNTKRGGHCIVSNTLYNSARSPILINRPAELGFWSYVPSEIAYNDVHDGMLFSLDTGLVYSYFVDNGNSRTKSRVNNNLVYYTQAQSNPYSFGIYWDNGTYNNNTFNNIVFTTENDVVFTHRNIFINRANPGGHHEIWNNSELTSVVGGKEALKANQFPNGMPFFGGAMAERTTPYTVNYDNRHAGQIVYGSNVVQVSEGAVKDESGIAFTANNQWMKLSQVDFKVNANYISLLYQGDRYNKTSPKVELYFDNEFPIAGTSSTTSFLLPVTSDALYDINKAEIKIPVTSGIHDLYIRVIEAPDNFKMRGVYISGQATEQDILDESEILSKVYCGDYSYCSPRDPASVPLQKYGAYEISNGRKVYNDVNPFVNSMWPRTHMGYYNIGLEKDCSKIVLNYCTADKYAVQPVQLRIGSPTAAPIAEFMTGSPGWSTWTDLEVNLGQTLSAGTYNVYLTFDDPGNINPDGCCNAFYLKFLK